ncbi:MAG: DNA repair protein RecN [Eubacterium sp.]|nr:DNA repair protein RecN [Eubacterium sp.]
MLKSLNIENIAVIEKAAIEFSDGLNVMTGETGAGKSIVVDAINAVLGERTSRELVRHGAQQALVTAVFEQANDTVRELLADWLIPADDELIIVRRITAAGKSEGRINGVRATAAQLKQLGTLLVNIHGQHDSQELLNSERHYRFIDMLAPDPQPYTAYTTAFQHLKQVRRELKRLTKDADDKDRQLEQLDYEIQELTAAGIVPGEREQLRQRRALLQNAQGILSALAAVRSAFSGDDETDGVQTLLQSAAKSLESVAGVDGELKKLYNMLTELTDAAEAAKDAAEQKLSAVEFSEGELEQLEERLDMYYRFSTRYGDTEEAMLAYLDNAVAARDAIVNSDEAIVRLSSEYDAALEAVMQAATALSDARKAVAAQLEREVREQLVYLDMPKIDFRVQFEQGNLSATGFDKIEFLISTNPGEPPKPLSKIASGGELSRIMLAIKSILAKADSVQTLIFDEIDTGVSGRASRKIGYKLQKVAKHTQVICVTHSAQIASLADAHLLIKKEFADGRTYTHVTPLNREQRKQELARIMGGMQVTETLLQSAEELLRGD